MWKGLLHQYKEFLPVTEETPMLTLHEGNTPLIHLPYLSEELGINLHVKVEGLNPTGSFKDRGMVMAVAKAKKKEVTQSFVHLLVIRLQQQQLMRHVQACAVSLLFQTEKLHG